jgi:membrane protease YdiL (CAAX protease family)
MREPLDVARYIFMNGEDELRSGWRVLAFVLFFLLAMALLTAPIAVLAILFPSLKFLLDQPPDSESLSGTGLIYLFADNLRSLTGAIIASTIAARLLERRSLASIGFKLHRHWLRDFLLGSGMGAAALAIAAGIITISGALTFGVQTRAPVDLARNLLIAFSFFVIAAATEELIFRGFPFQALVHNLGGFVAVAITSLVFGLAHLSNPGASVFSTINTILAGVWLGLAYLMTRSLWLATALHFSWNLAMVFIFGLPVSGITTLERTAWLKGYPGTPQWISGGSYGPEAGAAATVALILSTLAIWRSGLFNPSDEMLAVIQHGKREPALISVVPDQPTMDSALLTKSDQK